MPIKIPQNLPAYHTLKQEKIFVISSAVAEHQDIRPLEIVILNLMPKKIETETQLLRLLSNTPLQVNVELLHMASHISKNTPITHLSDFYTDFESIKNKKYDGMIITGAPIEQIDFEAVDYWDELCEIMEWSKTHVYSTMHICWGAQAALYYHYGVPKYPLGKKMFGIFEHYVVNEGDPLLHGFDEVFMVPHSRHTEIKTEDIAKVKNLRVLTESKDSGVHIVSAKNSRQYFITGHSEYDRFTLANEFFRDKDKGLEIDVPKNYFPNDDITKLPVFSWRCHANLMFSNWLNYCVYQKTPYNLDDIH